MSTASMPATASGPPSRVRRISQGAWVGGVCAGLARRLDVDPLLIRVGALAAGALSGGAMLAVYLLAWGFLPADEDAPPGVHALGWRSAVGMGLLAAAAVLALQELDVVPGEQGLVWPVLLTTAGVVLLWRAGTRATSAAPPVPGRPPTPVVARPTPPAKAFPSASRAAGLRASLRELPFLGHRTLAGLLLVVAGLVALLEETNAIGTLRDLVVAGAILLAGVTLIFGTSWLGLLETLREERAQRIRSDERAEMAAHLHDSVLQTLALIQRRAGDDREVAQLARRQERELRDWLAGRTASPDGPTTLAAALREVAADVEERHAVTVEVVTVGDVELDDHVAAVVRAAAEAAVNAAKFAGTGRVDVFAEARPDRVEVYVRDRGNGFHVDAVPEDRRGVRESIVGRMSRHGGTATVRSAPGEGTEVELVLHRAGVPS